MCHLRFLCCEWCGFTVSAGMSLLVFSIDPKTSRRSAGHATTRIMHCDASAVMCYICSLSITHAYANTLPSPIEEPVSMPRLFYKSTASHGSFSNSDGCSLCSGSQCSIFLMNAMNSCPSSGPTVDTASSREVFGTSTPSSPFQLPRMISSILFCDLVECGSPSGSNTLLVISLRRMNSGGGGPRMLTISAT